LRNFTVCVSALVTLYPAGGYLSSIAGSVDFNGNTIQRISCVHVHVAVDEH